MLITLLNCGGKLADQRLQMHHLAEEHLLAGDLQEHHHLCAAQDLNHHLGQHQDPYLAWKTWMILSWTLYWAGNRCGFGVKGSLTKAA